MLKGIQIDYKVKKGKNSRVAQLLYGRVSKSTVKDTEYAFYQPGILHDLPYHRIFNGRIFVVTDERPDFSDILYYCDELIISSSAKEDPAITPITGETKWKYYAKEKGWSIDGLKNSN